MKQAVYNKRYLILILFIAVVSTLPWIALGDFYTKGEPREAALATVMIEKGGSQWIIPQSYADEFAYKPPLNHWMMSAFSYVFTKGQVTPFTSRLPSTVAFVALIGICFVFFARRRSDIESFVACLLVITSFEIHRAAMTARIDMLLTFFLVASIIQLYNWYHRRRPRQLIAAWLLLSLATLDKGPVGIVIPCLAFGVYLIVDYFKKTLVQGVDKKPACRRLIVDIVKLIVLAIVSFLIPLVWYYAAYQVKGDDFLIKVFAENFGRFLRIGTAKLGIDYNLGVENPWYYYPVSLLAGFAPMTILLVISLFYVRYVRKGVCPFRNFGKRILSMEDMPLYGLITIVMTVLFFTVPASKRSVYIMVVYPFIALFMARYFIYLAKEKIGSLRVFTTIITLLALVVFALVMLVHSRAIDLDSMMARITHSPKTLHDAHIFAVHFLHFGGLGVMAMLILAIAIVMSAGTIRKPDGLGILGAAFTVILALNIFMDAYVLPPFKDAYSSKPFAEKIAKKYDLKDKTYVLNNLLKYHNLYGMNFYLHNDFKNFERELPESGYFLTGAMWIDEVEKEYGDRYTFTLLEKTDNKYNDYKDQMLLFRIQKKHPVVLN